MTKWSYYNTRFKFGNSPIYDFEILAGHRNTGEIEIYDVYPAQTERSTANRAPTPNGGRKSPSVDSASENNVPQPENKVNDKLSVRARGRDAAYMQALDSGDEEEAQLMVDEAARDAGYTDKAYHGSPSFGFTQFDMENGQGQIFVAYDRDLAKTYGPMLENKRIGYKGAQDAMRKMDSAKREEVAKEYFREQGHKDFQVRAISKNEYIDMAVNEIRRLRGLAGNDAGRAELLKKIEEDLYIREAGSPCRHNQRSTSARC